MELQNTGLGKELLQLKCYDRWCYHKKNLVAFKGKAKSFYLLILVSIRQETLPRWLKRMEMSIEQILEILRAGKLDQLIGLVEGSQFEAKRSPYFVRQAFESNTQAVSASDVQKHELAKDVSALANSTGGIILLGFETSRDGLSAEESITSCRPFDKGLVDLDQYRKILEDWIHPPIHSIRIDWYQSFADLTKGVIAITVPPEVTSGKPYVVKRVVEPAGKVRGTLIGYYARVQDRTPETSAERLRTWLRDGMRFEEIFSKRFDVIEKLVSEISRNPLSILPIDHSLNTGSSGVSNEMLEERIKEARTAVDRAAKPIIVLTATSESKTNFPRLFNAKSEPLVQLFENPPMRKQGFAVWNALHKSSEMIRGQLRRRLTRGVQILDLWQDGVLIAIGEGDYDLLCWWTRYPYSESVNEQSLLIRNFVLAEVTTMFIKFALDVFKYAGSPPEKLRFGISLENMSVNGLPCELSAIEDRTPRPIPTNSYKPAPGPHVSAEYTSPLSTIDIGRITYELLGGLYVQFGFHKNEMPYLEEIGERNRITLDTLHLSSAEFL